MILKFENPRRGRQARNFSENDPKILDLKSSSEQIVFRKLSLGAPVDLAVRRPQQTNCTSLKAKKSDSFCQRIICLFFNQF